MLTERPWTQGPHTVDVMGADQAHGDRSSMADQGETRPKCTGRDAEIDSQCGTNNAAGRLVSSVVRVGGGECGTRMQRDEEARTRGKLQRTTQKRQQNRELLVGF